MPDTLEQKLVKAIRMMEYSRLTHEMWAKFYEQYPEMEEAYGNINGNLQFHRKVILKYTFIIKVLKEAKGI